MACEISTHTWNRAGAVDAEKSIDRSSTRRSHLLQYSRYFVFCRQLVEQMCRCADAEVQRCRAHSQPKRVGAKPVSDRKMVQSLAVAASCMHLASTLNWQATRRVSYESIVPRTWHKPDKLLKFFESYVLVGEGSQFNLGFSVVGVPDQAAKVQGSPLVSSSSMFRSRPIPEI